jgi:hypothetical protein
MQNDEVEIIVKGIAKVITVISILILFGYVAEGCRVDSEIIIECQEACDSPTTTMGSVTARECICSTNKQEVSPWVLN